MHAWVTSSSFSASPEEAQDLNSDGSRACIVLTPHR
jgi:hypothetical protein